MPAIPSNKPYRVGRSRTGLGLFATKPIKKGAKIVRYFGPLLDSRKKKDDAIENKYLFELNNRWTIDGSVRKKKRAEARAEKLRLKAKAEKKALRKAEKQAAKAREKLEQNSKQKLNGKSNGELLNGHGGKSAAGKMIAAKSGIFAKPGGKPDRETGASA